GLPSFPTRRSSDLGAPRGLPGGPAAGRVLADRARGIAERGAEAARRLGRGAHGADRGAAAGAGEQYSRTCSTRGPGAQVEPTRRCHWPRGWIVPRDAILAVYAPSG